MDPAAAGEVRADPRETLAAVLARSFAGQRHCVQGAGIAQAEGDAELVAFFDHARRSYLDLAERAGALLAERMGGGLKRRPRAASAGETTGEVPTAGRERRPSKHPRDADSVDEASWESFPASDPPSSY